MTLRRSWLQKLIPYLCLVGGVTGISTSVVWIRWAGSRAELAEGLALQLAFWRMLFALPVMATWLLVLPSQQPVRGDVPWVKLRCIGAGVLLALHFYAWMNSMAYLPTALSVLLVSLHPVLVLAAEWSFRRKTRSLTGVVGVLLAVGGTAVLLAIPADSSLPHFNWGVLLALAGALSLGGYLLLGRTLRRGVSAARYNLRVFAVAALVLGVLVATEQLSLLPRDSSEWRTVGLMVLFPTILGHTLMNVALARLPATVVSTAFLGEIVGAALLAAVVLHEPLPTRFAIGAPIVVVGIALVCLRRRVATS